MSAKSPVAHFGPRDGQAIILMVVAMSLFLVGVLGFAIDGGQMYAQRQLAQAAADAAAEAGIMSIKNGTNATSTYTFGTGSTPIASYTCTTSDGRTPCVYARNNGFGGTASDTVTLSYPSSISGVTLASVTVPAFQVTVQRTIRTSFIGFIGGPTTTTVSAKAIAGITGSAGSAYCIQSIDPASTQKAISAGGGTTIKASSCGIAVNSTNSDALDVGGGASITASVVDVVGGDQIGGGGSVSPTPVTGAASVADPYASLPAPSFGSCTYTNYTPSNGAVISPTNNVYCGGITVQGGNTVTFSSGTFIIDGGGITFSGGSVSSGTGVTFFLTGTNSSYKSVTVSGSGVVNFTAPTSGTYAGILFFQDRTITSNQGATFGGGPMTMTGALYFPTTNVNYQSQGTDTTYHSIAIVANDITIGNDLYIQGSSTKSAVLAQ